MSCASARSGLTRLSRPAVSGHQAPQRPDELSRVGDRAELPFEIVPVGEEISSVIGREAVPRIDGKSIEDDD